jgi:cytochrome c-type biogenesis protein CcmH/NrfF
MASISCRLDATDDGKRRMHRRGVLMIAAALPLAGFRPVPEDEARSLLSRACTTQADTHRAILADLERRLSLRFTDEQARALLDELRCPHCGCSMLAAWRDAEGDAARF